MVVNECQETSKKKDIVLSVEWQWRRRLYDKENYPWKLGRARGIYIILT